LAFLAFSIAVRLGRIAMLGLPAEELSEMEDLGSEATPATTSAYYRVSER
jgi:hypothetical protein